MRLSSTLLLAALLGACPDYLPPEDARIACEGSDDCPTAWACEESVGRCVPAARQDKTAPSALDVEITPTAARAGDEVRVSFTVSEALDHDPVLTLGVQAPTTLSHEGLRYQAVFVIPEGEAADSGERVVTALLVDAFANEATQNLGSVSVSYGAPPPPLVSALLLREAPVDAFDPAGVDDSTSRFFLAGLEGAVSAPLARVYGDEALSQAIGADIPVHADESFAEVELPAGTSAQVWIVAVDAAGNESSARALAVPSFAITAVPPAVGRLPVQVSFTASAALRAAPVVALDGTVGAIVDEVALDYSYALTLAGTEREGVDAAVLRVEGDVAAQAVGSVGSSAVRVTVDFTSPTIDPGLVTVEPGASPSPDTLLGVAGALSDSAGADARPASGLLIRVLDEASVEIGAAPVAADGSFGPVGIGDDAHATVRLVVVDEAGNESTLDLNNDIGAPLISGVDVAPAAARSGDTVVISFLVEDDETALAAVPTVSVGGRYATFAAGSVDVMGTPVAFSYTFDADDTLDIEGELEVSIEAIDADGNRAVALDAVTFDFTAPVPVDIETPTAAPEWNAATPLGGTAQDDGVGLERVELAVRRDAGSLYFDGSAFTSATAVWLPAVGTALWSFDVGALPLVAGGHTVSARAVDRVGNVSGPGLAWTFTFDGTAPDTTLTSAPPPVTQDLDLSLQFACDDAPCTFTCSVDGAAAMPCTSPTTVSPGLGAHTVAVVATDVAGNVDPSAATVSFEIERRFLEISQSNNTFSERACGIAQDRSLWCWGENIDNALSFVTTDPHLAAPVQVGTDIGWSHVAVGQQHVCATRAGDLYCFGDNRWGQLGLGNTGGVSGIQLVATGGFDAIAAGEASTCALRDASPAARLYCWGSNYQGSAGHAPTDVAVLTPTEVDGGQPEWRSLSMGTTTVCGLRNDGSIGCFGGGWDYALGDGSSADRTSVGPVAPPTGQTWVDVAQEGYGACATTNLGQLWCWGSNGFGQAGVDPAVSSSVQVPTRVGTDNDWAMVARGNALSCATRYSGVVSCFGASFYGERGDGIASNEAAWVPVDVVSANRLWLGFHVSWFLAATGETLCVGRNAEGQCGAGTIGSKSTAVVVTTGLRGTPGSLSLGDSFSMALTPTGALRGAGQNDRGQLYDGTVRKRASFVNTGTGTFAAVSAGSGAACGRRADGTLLCWGGDDSGLLGGGAGDQSPGPVTLTGTFSDVSVGGGTACAVASDGTLWCWGYRLHSGSSFVIDEAPTSADAATDWASVAMGLQHGCGLKSNGAAFCFGIAGQGTTGDGSTGSTQRLTPRAVSGGRTWTQVVAGQSSSCGIEASTNLAWCWGSNDHGQLGNGGTAPSTTPVSVSDVGPWSRLAIGEDTVCGVKASGDVLCWGRDPRTQLAFPGLTPMATGAIDVDVGRAHICLLDGSGALSCLGDNADGQLGDGTGFLSSLTPVVQ